jgi:hypothetical protein
MSFCIHRVILVSFDMVIYRSTELCPDMIGYILGVIHICQKHALLNTTDIVHLNILRLVIDYILLRMINDMNFTRPEVQHILSRREVHLRRYEVSVIVHLCPLVAYLGKKLMDMAYHTIKSFQ